MNYFTPVSQSTQSSQTVTIGKKSTFSAFKWFQSEILLKKFKKKKSLSQLPKMNRLTTVPYWTKFSSQLIMNMKSIPASWTIGYAWGINQDVRNRSLNKFKSQVQKRTQFVWRKNYPPEPDQKSIYAISQTIKKKKHKFCPNAFKTRQRTSPRTLERRSSLIRSRTSRNFNIWKNLNRFLSWTSKNSWYKSGSQ